MDNEYEDERLTTRKKMLQLPILLPPQSNGEAAKMDRMENGMNSPITGDHPISNDTNTRRREKNREKQLLKNNLKTGGNKGVNRQKLVEENPNLSDGTGENGCETNKRSLKESYNIKKKLEIDEMSPSEDLLKNNLKTGGNKGINRQRLVEENPNLSDGTGENGCETNQKSLKESYNIKKKLEIDEMSPLEDRNSKLDGRRGKKLKNRSKGLLKPSDMAAEEQEENGENISELNPKSRYSRVDNGINVTENVLSKEAHKSGAEEEVSIVSLLNEGKPESNNENSERHKSKKQQRLLEEAAKADQRGVCYSSWIPPHMDPVKLRQILSQYGEIQRIYLSPEESTARVPCKRTNNKQHGGFQEQSFSEGWVEFSRKSVAKRVASMLNGEQIGGRKKSSFYYDLWNIKYLRKFKWDDLTEEIAYKNAIREQKLALEISAAKRERDFYLSKVDQSRALSSIEERIKKKQKLQQDAGTNSELPASQELKKVFRQFPQKQPVADNAAQSKPRLSKDILAGVFGDS